MRSLRRISMLCVLLWLAGLPGGSRVGRVEARASDSGAESTARPATSPAIPFAWVAAVAEEAGTAAKTAVRSDPPDASDRLPLRTSVPIPRFEIMRTPVTQAEFAAFLNETATSDDLNATHTIAHGPFAGDAYWPAGDYPYAYLAREGSRIQWSAGRFSVVPGYEQHPVVQVSWFGVHAFARHYGLRLPSEAQWEWAARGATDWDYPWGNEIDGSRANYWNSGDPFDNGTTPVGMYDGGLHGGFQTTDSPSPCGAYDMAGNVAEWTSDYWTATHRTEKLLRVVRGGSFGGIKNEIKCMWRKDLEPWQGYPGVGFRCVR